MHPPCPLHKRVALNDMFTRWNRKFIPHMCHFTYCQTPWCCRNNSLVKTTLHSFCCKPHSCRFKDLLAVHSPFLQSITTALTELKKLPIVYLVPKIVGNVVHFSVLDHLLEERKPSSHYVLQQQRPHKHKWQCCPSSGYQQLHCIYDYSIQDFRFLSLKKTPLRYAPRAILYKLK